MSVIDTYLKKVEPSARKQLERIRAIANATVPGAEEVISYGMPTLKFQGKPFLGFDAHKSHVGIYPYSGQVTKALQGRLSAYKFSSGAIRVPYDKPMPKGLLQQVIRHRLKAIKEASNQ